MDLLLQRGSDNNVVSRPNRFDLAPLVHPLWWTALAVLLINDNVLKGHGLVPGWLTGKLSDFAFLVVAPVVLGVILPGALPGRRPLAIAVVVGIFVAADLSPAVSDTVVASAALLGMRWRLWPDPTDLTALAALPLTIYLLYRRSPPAPSRGQWVRERAGVVLGAAACLATSAPAMGVHYPFLFNATEAQATVRVTWVRRAAEHLGCDAANIAAALNAADLNDARDVDLTSGQVAALNGPPPPGTSPAGVCLIPSSDLQSGCAAAILESPLAPPVLIAAPKVWYESADSAFIQCGGSPSVVSRCQPVFDPKQNAGPDAVTLKDVDGGRRFVAGAEIRLVPIDLAAIAARMPDSNDGGVAPDSGTRQEGGVSEDGGATPDTAP
jgi:hypothetical protein